MTVIGKDGHNSKDVSKQHQNFDIKAIGGSGVIFACDIQLKVPIAGVSTLFMEWRYLAVQGKYDNLNFRASILSYSKISCKMAPKISYLGL